MILDLDRFARAGQPRWSELESLLRGLEERPDGSLSLAEVEQLEDLYHVCAADLNRLQHGAVPGPLQVYLGDLVARAYGQIHARAGGLDWRRWAGATWAFLLDWPRVFRLHARLFYLALALTLAGSAFGALAVGFDPAATDVLLPAAYLSHPAARVAQDLAGRRPTASEATAFSAQLMTHNIQVSLLTLALGVSLGIGTGLMLFVNGVMLGAVAARYAQQGFGWFVAGWLLPHGAFEIPSVLIAGQAGFLLARFLLGGEGARVPGRGPQAQQPRQELLRHLLMLFGGLSILLVWAGLMEAFFSQRHAAGSGYVVQVAVGLSELLLLAGYLGFVGGTAP